jgi:diacylglycerol kinase
MIMAPANPVESKTSPRPRERGWRDKFADAFRGIKAGVHGQSSFFVHFFMAAAVMATALVMELDLAKCCVLLLCITVVLTAEMFNSALESIARSITDRHDPHVGGALDIGSGAVLIASIGAAVVGAIIFGHRLGQLLAWW